jgi:hypothetical protein
MKLDKVLEALGVPRFVKVKGKKRLEAVEKWRARRDEFHDRYKEKKK